MDAPSHTRSVTEEGLSASVRKRLRCKEDSEGRGQFFSLCVPLVPFCLLLLWTQQVVMGARADADVRASAVRRDVGFHGQGAYFASPPISLRRLGKSLLL